MGNISNQLRTVFVCAAVAAPLAVPPATFAQTPQEAAPGQVPGQAAGQAAGQSPAPGAGSLAPASQSLRPNYVLGPGDQIQIRAFGVEEIGQIPYRIDSEGNVNLPLLGKIKASGLTLDQLEVELLNALRKYVVQPQVAVTVVQYRSEPVFFVGAFRAPGIYPLQGGRTLVEMLSGIGGLQPNASRRIKVTRRKEFGAIPLPNAVESPDGKVTTIEISLGSLRENVNPAEDIVLRPFDVVTVERSEMVYVNGEVTRVGAIELGERESVSITQALTMAGGLTPNAKPAEVRVLRPLLNSSERAELLVDLTRIMEGKGSDFPLLPNDLVYVPRKSSFNQILYRAALIAVPTITTIIYVLVR